MVKRIAAIIFIWICTAVAWGILGSSIFVRSESSGQKLEGRVANIWGAPHKQSPMQASYWVATTTTEEVVENGQKKTIVKPLNTLAHLPLESSRIAVAFDLEHRQKGLMWFSTYKVRFTGTYVFQNTSERDTTVTLSLPFPAAQAVYDDLQFRLDGKPLPVASDKASAQATAVVPAHKSAEVTAQYSSQGLESWRYSFGGDISQVRDFELRMTTNFEEIDFPENTLAPTEKKQLHRGRELVWSYKNLVTGYDVAMVMPEKLQPGPLAGRISLFAPVSLFFFFFLMFIITTLRGIELHPMNYFFLAAAFFAFHLLLAYLADHISIHLAFAICSLVSLFLVVSYLRLVVGPRFAAVEAGVSQLIYLVGFSYAFFFKGYTGLTVTIGAIITLFVVMQMTGRIRWAERFASQAGTAGARGTF